MEQNTQPAYSGSRAGQQSDSTEMQDKYTVIPEFKHQIGAKSQSGSFSTDVYENLPPILADCCNTLEDHTEREVFLIGALAIISGMLPNVQGFYDDQFYTPHLYTFIIANHGAGKGSLKLAKKLGKPVHDLLKERSAQEIASWQEAASEASQSKQPPPLHPGNKMHYIPANNSKSGFIELLAENGGKATLFETEGDTLTGALKTDHGNFSDILRKAFHHENIAFYRRTNRENIEIDSPKLAVVLSATFGQYAKFIPSPEDGLFSRFMHFCPESSTEFRDVFSAQRNKYPEYFDKVGAKFKEIFEHLETLENPIECKLATDQKKPFIDYFSALKKDFNENVCPDMEGTSHRLALIAFRISMVLSAVGHFDKKCYDSPMVCTQVDFENTLRIMDVLKKHTLEVYHRLPPPPERAEYTAFKNELSEKADQVAQARFLASEGKGAAEIATIFWGDSKKRSTVHRWINAKK